MKYFFNSFDAVGLASNLAPGQLHQPQRFNFPEEYV